MWWWVWYRRLHVILLNNHILSKIYTRSSAGLTSFCLSFPPFRQSNCTRVIKCPHTRTIHGRHAQRHAYDRNQDRPVPGFTQTSISKWIKYKCKISNNICIEMDIYARQGGFRSRACCGSYHLLPRHYTGTHRGQILTAKPFEGGTVRTCWMEILREIRYC